MRVRARTSAAAALAAVVGMVLISCSGTKGFEGSGAGGHQVRLVQQPWEDLVVENQIVSQLLERLGYQAQTKELSVSLGAQALATGEADAYLGNWWPSQRSAFEKRISSGKVKVASTLVTGTRYAPSVPKYVVEKHGVRSLADLDRKGELFGRKILGIEPGSPGNQYIQDAIDNDRYGLGDWELVRSSTSAMLGEVERRVSDGKPVVFLGWKPHWMNVEWDLTYLDDPRDVWPGAGKIRVVHRKGFAEEHPNVARLLSQMEVDRKTASKWIYQLSKKNVPAKKIARQWIERNPDQVRSWLSGVRTADGEPAPTP